MKRDLSLAHSMNLSKELREVARGEAIDHEKRYNDLLEIIFRFLEQSFCQKKLAEEIKPSGEDKREDEMVRVPKKRYMQLIEIYSINMAEISAREIQKKNNGVNQNINNRLPNYINESQQRYKENYSNLIDDNKIEDMEKFFTQLSAKFGLEKLW